METASSKPGLNLLPKKGAPPIQLRVKNQKMQTLIGQHVYNTKNQLFGTIQAVISTEGRPNLYQVAAVKGYLGEGFYPVHDFTQSEGKLVVDHPSLSNS